jgi:phage/plasmid primase-like uncharacterized protein
MDFRHFAQAHGVEVGDLRTGDRIVRCATTTHPTSKNGAYFFDGRRGWVQNWESGGPPQWWNDGGATPWSSAEKRQWEMRRRVAEDERRKGHAMAARKATLTIISAARGHHPYLAEKGFPEAVALVGGGGELIIPMRDFRDNAILGLQTVRLIDNQWIKKNQPGIRAKGGVFRIGRERAAEIYFCEGYATGLSIDQALRQLRLNACVVVCFSAANMTHVAAGMVGTRYVVADHDLSGTGQRAAEATGLPWCMSPEVGEDANDLHVRLGTMAVAKMLMEVRLAKP